MVRRPFPDECVRRSPPEAQRVSPDDEADRTHPAVPDQSSAAGSLVLDAFLGSGSTLIACEETGRKCYGMEIDPRYVDVIVKRWEEFKGRKANLADAEREKAH